MNIKNTQYNVHKKIYEIYVTGCNIHCKGCHNYKIQDFNEGVEWHERVAMIKHDIAFSVVDTIWILGGEPLDQNIDELVELIKIVKASRKSIVLWTGYAINKVYHLLGENIAMLDYIKCGMYNCNVTDYKYYDEIKSELLSNQCVYSVDGYKLKLLEVDDDKN